MNVPSLKPKPRPLSCRLWLCLEGASPQDCACAQREHSCLTNKVFNKSCFATVSESFPLLPASLPKKGAKGVGDLPLLLYLVFYTVTIINRITKAATWPQYQIPQLPLTVVKGDQPPPPPRGAGQS